MSGPAQAQGAVKFAAQQLVTEAIESFTPQWLIERLEAMDDQAFEHWVLDQSDRSEAQIRQQLDPRTIRRVGTIAIEPVALRAAVMAELHRLAAMRFTVPSRADSREGER